MAAGVREGQQAERAQGLQLHCAVHLPTRACLCAAQLKAECPPEELEKLRQALGALTQPAFEYDRAYIADCLGWPLPATTPSAGGGPSQRPSAAGAAALPVPPACTPSCRAGCVHWAVHRRWAACAGLPAC